MLSRKLSRKKFAAAIDEVITRNRTHYIKWALTDDLSIRYFFLDQAHREHEGKFVIKSHNKRAYQIINSTTLAKQLIQDFNGDFEDCVEISGQLIDNSKPMFYKTLINHKNGKVIDITE